MPSAWMVLTEMEKQRRREANGEDIYAEFRDGIRNDFRKELEFFGEKSMNFIVKHALVEILLSVPHLKDNIQKAVAAKNAETREQLNGLRDQSVACLRLSEDLLEAGVKDATRTHVNGTGADNGLKNSPTPPENDPWVLSSMLSREQSEDSDEGAPRPSTLRLRGYTADQSKDDKIKVARDRLRASEVDVLLRSPRSDVPTKPSTTKPSIIAWGDEVGDREHEPNGGGNHQVNGGFLPGTVATVVQQVEVTKFAPRSPRNGSVTSMIDLSDSSDSGEDRRNHRLKGNVSVVDAEVKALDVDSARNRRVRRSKKESTKAMDEMRKRATGKNKGLKRGASLETVESDNRLSLSDEDQTTREPSAISRMEELMWEKSANLVCSPYFDYFSALLIVANSVLVGIQADQQAERVANGDKGDAHPTFRVFDVIFCVAFTLELFLRIFVHRRFFYSLPEWKWNVFDTLLVALQLAEEAIALGIALFVDEKTESNNEQGGGMNMSFLRVLRVLRLVRIVRLFRVLRIIGELRTIVASIAGCMRPLISALVLLLLMMYTVGVFFTQVVTTHYLELPDDTNTTVPGSGTDDELRVFFGSLPDSIYTLYKSILGGVDWGDVANPLVDEISFSYGLIFTLYIAFACLAMMNVMTGVFVEAALGIAKKDDDMYMVNHMTNLIKITDSDGSGKISLWEFEQQLDHPDMHEYFRSIDVDTSEGRALFHILDQQETGEIDAQDFVWGCLRLRGPARALDLEVLSNDFRKAMARSQAVMRRLEAMSVDLYENALKKTAPSRPKKKAISCKDAKGTKKKAVIKQSMPRQAS